MRILIVEDDFLQAETARERIASQQPDWDIRRIATESEFRENFASMAAEPPDVIILDMMLTWAWATKEMPEPPPDWDGTQRAGIRCARMLADDARTKAIPVIFFSLLEREDVGDDLAQFPHALFIRKAHNFDALFDAIRKIK